MAIKLRKWFKDSLHYKWTQGIGHPKEKGLHNETPYIHSVNTYKTYRSQADHFCDWCYSQGIRTPEAAKEAVKDYIKHLEASGKSPWTIYTAISAIAKVYGCSTTVFGIKPPKRERASVMRSRYAAVRDRQMSLHKEENKQLIDFCKSTGLRRRELEQLHGDALKQGTDGRWYVHVNNGKGGKERDALVIGSEKQVRAVCDRMEQAGQNLVFQHVHSKLDVHYYRSIYACDLYRSIARNPADLPAKEKYICRKDKAGIVYDRQAMAVVSRMLGHNRIDVIANSYLHNL